MATGDLAGCIDTWVLEDDEVLEQGAEITGLHDNASSSSDDGSSVDEANPPVTQGQLWTRSSAESPIPRLQSGILLLAFRPPAQPQPRASANGLSVHGNSAIFHLGSGNLPSSDDRLMVLTTEHQLVEFNVLKGKLSDWSRRNQKAYLPAEFTVIKDRAMGAIWDIGHGRERLWLYGPCWMWMFDLSQDFPSESAGGTKETAVPNSQIANKGPPSFKKRKREDDEGNPKGLNSGAGDRMALSESNIRLGRKMRKITGNDESKAEWIVLDRGGKQDNLANGDGGDEYDDEVTATNDSTLARLRREQLHDSSTSEDDDLEADNKEEINNGEQSRVLTSGTDAFTSSGEANVTFAVVIENEANGEAQRKEERYTSNPKSEIQALQLADPEIAPTHRRPWWHTFKYREVLGIVPLGSSLVSRGIDQIGDEVGMKRETVGGLEVAVVERPIWDVELPGRYVRDYE